MPPFRPRRALATLLSMAALACACTPPTSPPTSLPHDAPKLTSTSGARVTVLPLASPLDSSRAEISGLSWFGDTLILLPQFPSRFARAAGERTSAAESGAMFALASTDLRRAIAAGGHEQLAPRVVPIESGDLETLIPGFDGYESLVFRGDRVFVTIETRQGPGTIGYLVAGQVLPGPRIVLDASSRVELTPPVSIPNLGFEALTLNGDSILAFFEANGTGNVSSPIARRFTSELLELRPLPLCAIDYRITAASSVDAEGRFWVMNYFWPGEPFLARPGDDARTRKIAVEQIVELAIADGHIVRTDRAPIRFAPDPRGRSRNWEGLVRFGDDGFLVVTDEHPDTLLGYVELQPK